MAALFQNILTASFHGSIVIAAVLCLRLILRKAPKKYICYLWLLAGVRLLMPFEIQSDLSLQPQELTLPWKMPDLSGVIPWLWLAVGSLFLLYSLVGYVNLRKKVRHSRKIPGGWETKGINTAFILGFVRPQIYIPVGMAPGDRKHILAHEQTHLDKGDHWIKMIGFLALALHWFNPLVWIAYILLCKDIEMACDERVVQFMELPERKEYSAALLNCSTNQIHFAASPVAFGEVSVKSRITSILNYRKPSFWVGLLSVIAIVFVMVCLVTSPTAPPMPAAPLLSGSPAAEVTEPMEPAFSPAEPQPMTDNPDWGLGIIAEPLSNTTMTLYYGVNVDDIPWDGTPLYKDHPYWFEKWNGEGWEKLPMLVQTPSYEGSYGLELSRDNAHSFYSSEDLNWSLTYGPLPEGDYRIALQITRNGETKPCYGWFHIYANALTGKESEAVNRCETAIKMLTEQSSYGCRISSSLADGTMVPQMEVLKNGGNCRVDFYYGSHCYSNYLCEPTDRLIQSWDDEFRLEENKFISFPEGESLISAEEIRFVTQWTDTAGIPYYQTNCYRFDEHGSIASVSRITKYEENGTTVENQQELTVWTYYGDITSGLPADAVTDTAKDTWEAAEESPWGIHFRVDDDLLKPTGGEVWMSLQNSVGVSNYTTDSNYWLEQKTGDKWAKLPADGAPNWGSETYRLGSRTSMVNNVDWSDFYATLEPGLYRMGKHFFSGEESCIQYAEFVIYPESGIHGSGAEEALARVDAALEKLCSGNYHIIHERSSDTLHGKTQINTVHWKYGDVCVTDYYDYWRGDGYSHSSPCAKDDPNADLFYNYFMGIMNWHEDYHQTYFDPTLSVVSDREISFAVGSTRYSSPMLNYYSFYFDEKGVLTHFTWQLADTYSPGGINLYTVQTTPEAEIQAWVEKIQAEQA